MYSVKRMKEGDYYAARTLLVVHTVARSGVRAGDGGGADGAASDGDSGGNHDTATTDCHHVADAHA
jgi:hypothetical protein